MKKFTYLLLFCSCMALFASCAKDSPKEAEPESRYYVRYTGQIYTAHIINRTFTFMSDKGEMTYTEMSSGTSYTVTIGPVQKGFKASISCDCAEDKSLIKKQSVIIEVSKDNDPFALKASGERAVSYVIDY